VRFPARAAGLVALAPAAACFYNPRSFSGTKFLRFLAAGFRSFRFGGSPESQSSMSRTTVNQLANGDNVDAVFLIADKQLRANRQGGLYLHLDLRDKTGSVAARLWNVNETLANRFETGGYLHAKGKVQIFQGALQIILANIENVDSSQIETAEFLPEGVRDPGKLLARLREILRSLNDPHLRSMADLFLMDEEFVRKFTTAPAGIKNHHAYSGGLLEHVVTMLTAANRIIDLYPDVNRDLLLAGIFLHDIGKIDELSYDRNYGYTDEGQLIGHLVMGVAILREKLTKVVDLTGEPFPTELRLRLEHMIVSHHGSYEFGSARLPMTPEAIALNCLDNLDAKIHLFTREIRDDPSKESSWTPFQQSLGRKLYKGNAADGRFEDESAGA
jgi:3'-5' exoribonuclease